MPCGPWMAATWRSSSSRPLLLLRFEHPGFRLYRYPDARHCSGERSFQWIRSETAYPRIFLWGSMNPC
ncbi:hypothetical protein ACFFX0_18945 [Citricoccus parietis]|uniref:Uncharacterized protein n=1 Tax=Citricoccus parietis TaxID=592307 RepID=A0ABV5G2L9_9MICC